MNESSFQKITKDILNNCCITCLGQRDLISMYTINYEGKSVTDLLSYCVSLNIKEDKELSKICSSCFEELKRLFIFKLKCHLAYKNLQNALNNFQLETLNGESDLLQNKTKECSETNGDSNDTILNSKGSKSNKTNTLSCKVCLLDFKDVNSLRSHKKEMKHLIIKKYQCIVCNKVFTKSKLKQHMRVHTKEKPYQCEKCFKGFSMLWNLNRHIMTHTGEKPFVCDICGKGFIQAVTLSEHKLVHTGDAAYICCYCGKRFTRSTRHKTHLRLHLEEKKRESENKNSNESQLQNNYCEICKRNFANKGTLKMHMLRHGEKSFLCSDCGKKFYTKDNLISHSKIHATDSKPSYMCNVCDKAFTSSSVLKTHMLTHTSQKPHICKICFKGFKQHQHLKYHMRVHSGEKPYKCNCCGKAFTFNSNLTVHLRTHTGETPYVCGICDKSYSRLNNMKIHQATHNQKEIRVTSSNHLISEQVLV